MSGPPTLLVLNAGSSSIKFASFAVLEDGGRPVRRLRGEVDGIGDEPTLTVHDASGTTLVRRALGGANGIDHERALGLALDWMERDGGESTILAAGHRVVHGGRAFSAATWIAAGVVDALEALVPLAPLHQPHNLAGIRALAALRPELPQVACFDTEFHRTQPWVARTFALPRELTESGIERYGFHGLSYQYVASVLPDLVGAAADGRVIVAHLGAGASLCAMRERRSVATTMSFTALDGVPMGTRSGELDPGVILYLLSERGLDTAQVTDLLYHRSGLLGVSGISGDVRALLANTSAAAREALDLFVYRVSRAIGSLAAALGGLDVLVFTAGIGEHAAPIRARVARDAGWLGIRLDEAANEAHRPRISTDDSPVAVWIVPTDEEVVVAEQTLAVLATRRDVHARSARSREGPDG
jgi:acetate kinase